MARPVKTFVAQALLWLPVAFAAWYYMSIIITQPLTFLVGTVMTSLFPDVIAAVSQHGNHLEVVTRFAITSAPQTADSAVREPVLVFTLNPLMYGYSMPLFTALALATPDENGKWLRWALGILALYPFQAWGVCLHILKAMLFGLGPSVAAAMPLSGWQLEAVALGYQFGFLILPAAGPVILWLALYWTYVIELAPSLEKLTPRGRQQNRGA